MGILVFNSGSSSLKFQLFQGESGEPKSVLKGVVRTWGEHGVCDWVYGHQQGHTAISAQGHGAAAKLILTLLERRDLFGQSLREMVTAIGHRVVHGGELFHSPVVISPQVLTDLEGLSFLAPLHNPPALEVIRACQASVGDKIPMVAVFDTAFFHGLPAAARVYGLPQQWTQQYGCRRYGFHGLAHRSLYEDYLKMGGASRESSRVITLQLGHGCSMSAIHQGQPVDTSMGFTPLEGLIMATRPGDVDAGILLYLLTQQGLTPQQLEQDLNHSSGLLGLSGVSGDMAELLALEAQGHAGAALAVTAFCHRVRKYLGAYLALLGGADAVVFGGGIGEGSPQIRERICANMTWCGLKLDIGANNAALGGQACISVAGSLPAVYVFGVDEEKCIAQDTQVCLS